MFYQKLTFSLLVFFASAAALEAQDRCLQITKLPAPSKPVEKIALADTIWVRLRVEFKGDGTLGSVSPIAAGLDKRVDALVLEAAKGIEFIPKRIGNQPVTVKHDINYTYTFSKGEWSFDPNAGKCLTQSGILDDSQENSLKTAARQFVKAWTESHDLRPLTKQFFLPGFTSVIGTPEMAPVGEELFRSLSDSERERAFFAVLNYMYAQVVIMQSKPKSLECWDESPECDAKRRESMLRLFSSANVDRVLQREKDDKEPKTKAEFLEDVGLLDKVFEEALPVLQRKNLEQTDEFRNSMKLLGDDYNLDYLIKPGVASRDCKDRSGRVIIGKGDKIFGVETPLIIRVDFVLKGNEFKVFNIGAGDGD